ncbi:MAG: site-specific DNA-methyltransferase [Chloroflexi bacterium]|nr:site-specific DNA-methyltransferase [Chloroflexota bacterium]
MPKKTRTSSFGVSKREGHDSSPFYNRSLYGHASPLSIAEEKPDDLPSPPLTVPEDWCDRIYCQSSEKMPLPDDSIALAFTSPPYNVGKDYDEDRSLEDYFRLIKDVGREVYRVLKPGGRYVLNVANLGRKPYLPMHTYFYQANSEIGFLPMGEIIWQKARGANGSCAWGSWESAKAPRIRDIHEYLLVFAKQGFSRAENGESDISREEFLASTLSVWQIPPESARRVGHPAPFPIELAARVIKLYSYVGDVVLDPFAGSGTTCVAAKQNRRHYVGFDIVREYCQLAEERCKASQ